MNATFATVLAAMRILLWLLNWARDAQVFNDGQREMLLAVLREQASAITRADQARDQVRARNARVPASDSLPDDGFRRD